MKCILQSIIALCVLLHANLVMSNDQPKPQFRPLPIATQHALDQQRAFIGQLLASRLPGKHLTKTAADFTVIQQLIDLHAIPKDQTWQLQALGVVFGDALTATIPGLTWCEITDEYGSDPTLRYRETSVQINALTILSKRIEDGEQIDVADMAKWINEFVNKKHGDFE